MVFYEEDSPVNEYSVKIWHNDMGEAYKYVSKDEKGVEISKIETEFSESQSVMLKYKKGKLREKHTDFYDDQHRLIRTVSYWRLNKKPIVREYRYVN